MSFAWPWCFIALPLPCLLRWLWPPLKAGAALRLPYRLPDAPPAQTPPISLPLRLAILAWCLLVIAAARPQVLDEALPAPWDGRNLMLAFDLSASMAIADVELGGQTVDRLTAARAMAGEFLRRHPGDRVGLIVLGNQAYLHTPLSFDLEAVQEALATMEVGLAGRETALGDAIALATKHLQTLPEQDRVLVILSDGANTAGTLTPLQATWLAQRGGLRIHALGLGALPTGQEGAQESLRRMAGQTGGIYLRATDSATMTAFWRRLEDRAPGSRKPFPFPSRRELYAWPLGLALILSLRLILGRIQSVS